MQLDALRAVFMQRILLRGPHGQFLWELNGARRWSKVERSVSVQSTRIIECVGDMRKGQTFFLRHQMFRLNVLYVTVTLHGKQQQKRRVDITFI